MLIAAAFFIFVVPFRGIWLFAQLGWALQQYLYGLADAIAWSLGVDPAPDKVLEWLRRNDWRGWAAWQGSGTIYSWGLRIESWRIPKVLAIMLIGLVTGRRLVTGGILDNCRLLAAPRVLGGVGDRLAGQPCLCADPPQQARQLAVPDWHRAFGAGLCGALRACLAARIERSTASRWPGVWR